MTGKAHEVNEATKLTPVANRKFKDTVFRMLFSDKESLLSLYNAVNNSHYTDSGALEIVTLENAIYMGMKNDLAVWFCLAGIFLAFIFYTASGRNKHQG